MDSNIKDSRQLKSSDDNNNSDISSAVKNHKEISHNNNKNKRNLNSSLGDELFKNVSPDNELHLNESFSQLLVPKKSSMKLKVTSVAYTKTWTIAAEDKTSLHSSPKFSTVPMDKYLPVKKKLKTALKTKPKTFNKFSESQNNEEALVRVKEVEGEKVNGKVSKVN